jgi:hypothetical protein
MKTPRGLGFPVHVNVCVDLGIEAVDRGEMSPYDCLGIEAPTADSVRYLSHRKPGV